MDQELLASAFIDTAQHSAASDLMRESSNNVDDAKQNYYSSQCCIATYARTKGLPQSTWEQLRPIITKLYVDEERRLDEVICIMREQYGFDATVQMYKKKFASWKIRKYYSRRQKDEIIFLQETGIMRVPHVPHDTFPFLLNKKRVKQHRIERYRRLKHRLGPDRSYSQLSFPDLQHSPETRNVEIVLLETKYYIDWYFAQPDFQVTLKVCSQEEEIFGCCKLGVTSLGADPRTAFALLNKACSSIPNLMQMRTLSLVYHFLYICSDADWWDGHEDARLVLMDYFCATARRVLGTLHPVSRVLILLRHKVLAPDILQRVGRLLLDVIAQSGHGTTEQAFQLRVYIASLLDTGSEGLDFARKEVLSVLLQTEYRLGQNHDLVQTARYYLSHVHFARAELLEAERGWLEIVQLALAEKGREYGSAVSTICCWRLGMLYRSKEQKACAELYFRLALQGAIHWWGAKDPRTLECLGDVEDVLESLGRTKEIK